MKKVFPIQTDTACLLKWAWSTVFLYTKTTSSCHRVNQDNISLETFDSFHNTKRKIRHREMMLNGKWPGEGCEYCRDIEYAGGVSDRQFQLESMTHKIPEELLSNPSATAINPTLLEVYFSNLCNMSCLYCGSYFSTVWEAENKKYGDFKYKTILLENAVETTRFEYEQLVDKLFEWLEKNHQSLQTLQILGGEPFYQTNEVNRIINFFDANPNPNISISFISNLKVNPEKFKTTIDRFLNLYFQGKIGSLNITGSLDCWGKEAEYIRYGLDLKEWQSNYEYIIDKPITCCINTAISSLSIKAMPDFIEKINYWNSIRVKNKDYNDPIFWSFMTIQPPETLRPDIFDPNFFSKDFEKIISIFPDKTEYQQQSKEHMIGIAKQIASTSKDNEKIQTLKIYLNEIDRRRGTNWHELFPWLVEQ